MINSAHCHDAYGVVVVTVIQNVVTYRHNGVDLSSSFYDDEVALPSFEATRKKQKARYNCCWSSSLGASCGGSKDPRKSEARKPKATK